MKVFIFVIALSLYKISPVFSQKRDSPNQQKENTSRVFFIISAGEKINAYFNDKPLAAETIPEFNEYVRVNIKILRSSWVVISGKPKTGTYDDVIKTLNKYRFKNVTKSISAN